MKKCSRCCEEKEASCFGRASLAPDGLQWWCKACSKVYFDAYRKTEKGKQMARDAAKRWITNNRWYVVDPKRVQIGNARRLEWNKKNLVKRAAHHKVRRAVASGELIPWPVCAVSECSARPVAHHPDYSRPLDVVWLCTAHHKQAHALLKEAA